MYLVGRSFETMQTSCFSSYFLPTNFNNYGWGLPTVITVVFAWWSFSISITPSTFINRISPGRHRVVFSSPFTDLFNYLFYSMGYNLITRLFVIQIFPSLTFRAPSSWFLCPFEMIPLFFYNFLPFWHKNYSKLILYISNPRAIRSNFSKKPLFLL